MATKAQRFRSQQQRAAHPPRTKQPRRPRRDLIVDTALPNTSATDRKPGIAGARPSNWSLRAAARGGAALETSNSKRPSRKSTRKSSGGVKRTHNLRLRARSQATRTRTR